MWGKIERLSKVKTFFTDQLPEIFPAILIALMGGFARFMLDKKLSWAVFATNIVVSGFTGTLTYNLCSYYQMTGNISNFLIGMSGFLGVNALAVFSIMFKSWMGGNKGES